MICPDCDVPLIKTAIQCADLSGWYVGWICDCEHNREDVRITIHAGADWTARPLLDIQEGVERVEAEVQMDIDMVNLMINECRA